MGIRLVEELCAGRGNTPEGPAMAQRSPLVRSYDWWAHSNLQRDHYDLRNYDCRLGLRPLRLA